MALTFRGRSPVLGSSAGQSLSKSYSDLVSEISESQQARRGSIEELLDKIIDIYSPGGAFGKGYEKQLALQKVQDVGTTAQRDISRGLYGIRPYEQEWEATVGSTARLKLEDLRMQALAGAYGQKAGFLEGIQEPYPDYGALMNATAAEASVPSSGQHYGMSLDELNALGGSNYTPGGAKGTGGTVKGMGGMPGEYSGQNITAEPGKTYGNLLGSFDPEQANIEVGNVPVEKAPQKVTSAPQLSPTEAIKQFATYEEFASWAKGQGMNPGTKAEWQSVKNRIK